MTPDDFAAVLKLDRETMDRIMRRCEPPAFKGSSSSGFPRSRPPCRRDEHNRQVR